MKKVELQGIIEKYQRMSENAYQSDEEKGALYERIANQLENDIDTYVDNKMFSTEEDVVDDIKGMLDDVDNFYDDEDYENMDMLDE
jgi:hypothetical protein